MAIREIPYQSKDEWLEIRKHYVGGSDAGAVVGLNPYKSAYALWAEKCGYIQPFAGNLTTEVGAYLEAFVADLWSRETGKKVRRKNRVLVSDQYPFACADVDRVVIGEKALLECKTTTSVPIMRQLRNCEDFPDAYYAQCVHYLAVTGYDRIYLAVLVNNRELLTYTLERDEDEIAALMGEEEYFWNHNVMHRQPPAVDGSESTTQALTEIYDGGNTEEIRMDGVEDQIRIYETLGQRIKEMQAEQKEAANRVKAYMGNAEKGQSASYLVSYACSSRTTFDKEKFLAAYQGQDVTPFFKTTTSRTLRIKPISA